jgi:hypothetical protein
MSNSSLLTRIPENTSLLQPNKFTFSFTTLPFLKYFCQSVSIPGVSTSAVPVETPFSNTFRHGDKLVYDGLNISALLDEDIRVWEETYNWLLALTFPKEFRQYYRNSNNRDSAYHDGILTINTNANNPNVRFKFTNCHPVSLSGISFDTTQSALETMTIDIGFRYDGFEIERL